MKDCFLKIEQEDEARVRFKQRVVRRLLEADAINILVGYRPWQRINLLIKTYSVEIGLDLVLV